MARSKNKKYTSQSLTGQKGVNIIEGIVLEMGFVWNPTNLEAGIDGTIEIRDDKTEEATNFIIQVQSKATSKSFSSETNKEFEYVCNERDLDYWMKGNCPVILICSNVNENCAYWISIKDYFHDSNKRKNRKVYFDKAKTRFTLQSKNDLLNLGVPILSGFYLSPPPVEEEIFSNLLRLNSYPNYIYEAKTKYRKNKELWSALNELESTKGINKSWILIEGKILSFNDLNQTPWINFISSKKVNRLETEQLALSNDVVIKRQFVQLLNHTFETFVHHKRIIHRIWDKINLYYFRPVLDDDGLPKTSRISYNRLGRNSKQKTCERYYRKSDPTIISYYRHLAFEIQFLRFENDWFLELTPTYYFTHDGFMLHTYYEGKLKGKKGLDRAETVFSETIFWADILTRDNDSLFGRDVLSFDFLYHTNLDVGVDDKQWLAREDSEKKKLLNSQLSLFDHEN